MPNAEKILDKHFDIIYHFITPGGWTIRVASIEDVKKDLPNVKIKKVKVSDGRPYEIQVSGPFPLEIQAAFWKREYEEAREQLDSAYAKLSAILEEL